MASRFLVPFLAACALGGGLAAQQPAADFDPARATADFLAAAGPGWRVHADPERAGAPALVFGGARALVDASLQGAQLDAAYVAAARQVVGELSGALGFGNEQLVLDGVRHLDLSRALTRDKVVVSFHQAVDGLRVQDGWVTAVFLDDGRLVAVDSTALPDAGRAASLPQVDPGLAALLAQQDFLARSGRAARSLDLHDYLLVAERVAPDAVRAAPAFVFLVQAEPRVPWSEPPARRLIAVAATGTPRVVQSRDLVHHEDGTGSVQGWGQPGLKADGWDPDALLPLKDVRLAAAGLPSAYSADDGGFVLPGLTGPTTVTASFNGQWSRINNVAGAEASIPLTVTPGTPATFTFNTALAEQQTAEVNAHRAVERMRDWLKGVDPTEDALDFQVQTNVNLSSTCNAYYDWVSINFYKAGGGCPNSAYATVVWHEEGHWANDLFSSGNGWDGFGEGAADCWAMYIADDPVIAPDFYGPGAPIRTGLNTRAFCGDTHPGCYGEVHVDGEPLMGAVWKVRARLQSALGQAGGGQVADRLLLAWFQVFNDSLIKSIILEHWLVLDDDDGNLDNGSPHYAQINGGFTDQGFPGYPIGLFVSYGAGTPGSGGLVPQLAGGGKTTLGQALSFLVSDGPPSAPGALYIGFGTQSLPAMGGTFLVAPPFVSVPVFLDGSGGLVLDTAIPNDPRFLDVLVALQAWFLDAGGPKGKSATNGVHFTIQ